MTLYWSLFVTILIGTIAIFVAPYYFFYVKLPEIRRQKKMTELERKLRAVVEEYFGEVDSVYLSVTLKDKNLEVKLTHRGLEFSGQPTPDQAQKLLRIYGSASG